MTVGAGAVVLGPFIPNGLTTDWPFRFDFAVFGEGEVVPRLVTAAGSSIPAHSVAIAQSGPDAGQGGSVVIAPALATGSGQLYISYIPVIDQQTQFEDQARFSPAVMNGALDRGAARDRYLDARLDRAQKAPVGEAGPAIPSQSRRAGSFRLWSADGSAERTDVTDANLAGLLEPALEASLARRDLANVADATLRRRVLALGVLPTGGDGAAGGLDLSTYLDPAARIDDIGGDPAAWTDVSDALRQAFADAGDLGQPVDATRCRGLYFIDPATPILVRRGSGFIGPDTAPAQLGYAVTSVDEDGNPTAIKDAMTTPGLVFVVNVKSARNQVPKFALQGATTTRGLQIAGVGLLSDAAAINVSDYGGETGIVGSPTDHAPVICTDHRHDAAGLPVASSKAGNVTLACHLVGLMQGAYIGDPLPSEEPWAAGTASGQQTGITFTDITITASPMKRVLGLARSTSGGLTARVQAIPPYWTGISQPNSGGLTHYSLLKWFQRYGRVVDMWHRAVGFNLDIQARGFRYGVYMQAGYFPAPVVGRTYHAGDIVGAAGAKVFICATPGVCSIAPTTAGPYWSTATNTFSDPRLPQETEEIQTQLSWTLASFRNDTGKYNAGTIRLGCERVVTAVHVEPNAYLHRVNLVLGGHYMDEYNLKGETGALLEVLSDGAVAGSIDKAVYDLGEVAHEYSIGDKISDGYGNVFNCTAAGTCTVLPTTAGLDSSQRFHDPSGLVWIFRNAGFKPFGQQPFARWYASGVVNETAGPAFLNTDKDAHVFVGLDGLSVAQWSQASHQHDQALIRNRSAITVLSHKNSQTYASANALKVYDVADESRLRVGGNDYFGPYSLPPDGSDPPQLSSNLSADFFAGKNCFVYTFGDAGNDDESDDGEGGKDA